MSSGERIVTVELRDEMRKSFMDYAMSVIVSRAIPDVRDGLKPVHRRIIYGMYELGLTPDSRYRKAAKTVGDVMGNYHPHGDSAIYEALVRLAQPTASRYTLVDGHGNFGDLDNPPAAMRYTEARLTRLAMEMLADIDAETVDTRPNFDDSRREPVVLPSRVPTLLLNGSAGIAVGMATNIPPHNLREVVDGVIAKIDNPALESMGLMDYIKGPDFPSGGIIMGRDGVREAYQTGRGSVPVRGVATIEQIAGSGGRQSRMAIIVTSLPYMVGPEAFTKRVADLGLGKDEKIAGISDVNDETDRTGLRVVIELKRDAHPEVVLNNLYKHTQLQQSFPVNTLALIPGRTAESGERRGAVSGLPATLSLAGLIDEFIRHREEVVIRRTRYLLKKAEDRAHILEGYLIALAHIDEVIAIIRGATSTEEARTGLMTRFKLSEPQANAILEMQLRRLTGLERGKIEKEHEDTLLKIEDYKDILLNRSRVLTIIKEELTVIKEKYGDDRRTMIVDAASDGKSITAKDLVPNERMAIFITTENYIKRTPLDTFRRQKRNTRGVSGVKTKDEDDLRHFFIANTHDKLLVFSNRGQVFAIDILDIPESSRSARGLAMVNLIPLGQDDNVTAVIPVEEQAFKEENNFFVMLTLQGQIKKVAINEFGNIRKSGIIAITLGEEKKDDKDDDKKSEKDELGWVRRSNNSCDIIIGTSEGMVIRFSEQEVRPLGRSARGVRAISLRENDKIVGFDVIEPTPECALLIVTTDGFGKRVSLEEFRQQGRAGLGIIGIKFKNAQSRMACLRVVRPGDGVVIATMGGIVVRQRTDEISMQGRMATGVRLQQIKDDSVVSVTPVVEPDAEVDSDGATTGGSSSSKPSTTPLPDSSAESIDDSFVDQPPDEE